MNVLFRIEITDNWIVLRTNNYTLMTLESSKDASFDQLSQYRCPQPHQPFNARRPAIAGDYATPVRQVDTGNAGITRRRPHHRRSSTSSTVPMTKTTTTIANGVIMGGREIDDYEDALLDAEDDDDACVMNELELTEDLLVTNGDPTVSTIIISMDDVDETDGHSDDYTDGDGDEHHDDEYELTVPDFVNPQLHALVYSNLSEMAAHVSFHFPVHLIFERVQT